MKEEFMENEEHRDNIELAKELGITVDELNQTVYEIEADTSKDDHLYGYYVEFDVENSPARILNKIKDLEDGCRVSLPPSWGDSPDPDDY